VRVLFLTHRLPYAPNRGDRLRAFHMLRAIRQAADVDLVSLVHDDDEASHAAEAQGLADRVLTLPVSKIRNAARGLAGLLTSTPLTHLLLDAPGARRALASFVSARRPDVVLAFCSGMARFAFETPLDALPAVVDLVDVDSAKWQALAGRASWPVSMVYAREARHLARFERVITERAVATLVVNERERGALLALAPASAPTVVENGVDIGHFASPRPPSARPAVVFSGVMNYAPNAQGAVWLARDVWPRVRRERPDAELLIVGASPADDVRALPRTDTSITVTGTVPSVREYLWDAAMAVAPLRVARGVQNKVIEAVAAGLPCVVTPEVDGGVPTEIRSACQVRDSAAGFAETILELLGRSPAERRTLAMRADVGALDWTARMRPLMPILEAAAGRRAS
jgi:polysaccharide biosynthesis protein PslH